MASKRGATTEAGAAAAKRARPDSENTSMARLATDLARATRPVADTTHTGVSALVRAAEVTEGIDWEKTPTATLLAMRERGMDITPKAGTRAAMAQAPPTAATTTAPTAGTAAAEATTAAAEATTAAAEATTAAVTTAAAAAEPDLAVLSSRSEALRRRHTALKAEATKIESAIRKVSDKVDQYVPEAEAGSAGPVAGGGTRIAVKIPLHNGQFIEVTVDQ